MSLNLRSHWTTLILLAASWVCSPASAQSDLLAPTSLQCDGQIEPLAISSQHPELSWLLSARPGARGVSQSKARVVIASSSAEVLNHHADIWDSGELLRSDTHISIAKTLLPESTFWWSVKTWDERGHASTWSAPARFATAPTAWTAPWIAAAFSTAQDGSSLDGSHPMPEFRYTFGVHPHVAEAFLRIAGLGQYEGTLNHERIGPPGLLQAWTNYRKTITYDTFDITKQLHTGTNNLAVLLGNGMYNVQHTKGRYTKFEASFGIPMLTAELTLRYADGHVEHRTTGTTWKAAPGPIRFSSTYGGEDLDPGKQPTDSQWQPAILTTSPGGIMRPAIAALVTEHEHHLGHLLAPPSTDPTAQIFDIEQNIAGWPRITLQASKGGTLRITPGELLKPDGSVSQTGSGSPQWWTVTATGSRPFAWQPHFSYYGFRYLQLQWTKGTGHVNAVEGIALHSSSPPAGTFTSSSDMLNRIHHLILSAMHNNEVSLFTDCPHREKLGWLEETQLVAPALLFNDDLASLYRATAQNIADSQSDDGSVPTIAPQYTHFGPRYAIYDDSPEWGSATILGPWQQFRMTGDSTLLREHYDSMVHYLNYLQSRATNGIVAYGLGDWYDIGPNDPGVSQNTTLGVTGTLMLYEDAAAMAKIAKLLGRNDDAVHFTNLADNENDAFQKRFFHPLDGKYDTGSQTANAMPLDLGIVAPGSKATVLANLIANIQAHNDHGTSGEVGYPSLVRALLNNGRSDVLLAMLLRTDPPSYGSQLAAGATSLTEAWDANPRHSQDHFMLGAADEWFYRGLAGIDIDFSRANPAQRITISPTVLPGITSASATYQTTFGQITSSWRTTGNTLTLNVNLPAGASATLHLPGEPAAAITESGTPSSNARGVTRISHTDDEVTFQLSSGQYHFQSSLPPRR